LAAPAECDRDRVGSAPGVVMQRLRHRHNPARTLATDRRLTAMRWAASFPIRDLCFALRTAGSEDRAARAAAAIDPFARGRNLA
jgi:hypothetical protein